MTLRTIRSGGRLEEVGAYARARRVGPFVYVAGTTAIEPSGRLHAPGDAYAQSLYIFARIEAALEEAGARMRHVVRTRAFLTDMAAHGGGYLRAHGEIFRGIDPVTSGVEAGLSQPGLVIEIEADAVIFDEDGKIAF